MQSILHSPVQALKMRTQVGERRFPDSLDIDSLSEFYHRLVHAIGAANSMAHSPCLTSTAYPHTGFIACQDFEACPQAIVEQTRTLVSFLPAGVTVAV